jgi:hypothetical protein
LRQKRGGGFYEPAGGLHETRKIISSARENDPSMTINTAQIGINEAKIQRHAVVTYTDGTSEVFDALQITDSNSITFGKIVENEGKFIIHGFIPRLSIKDIAILSLTPHPNILQS